MSDGFNVEGKVTELGDAATSNGYTERTIVVTVDGRYPQVYPVRFADKTGDAVAKLDGVRVGDVVAVDFDVRSRKSRDGKWFVNLDGWRVANKTPARVPPRDRRNDGPPPPIDDDGLPF